MGLWIGLDFYSLWGYNWAWFIVISKKSKPNGGYLVDRKTISGSTNRPRLLRPNEPAGRDPDGVPSLADMWREFEKRVEVGKDGHRGDIVPRANSYEP